MSKRRRLRAWEDRCKQPIPGKRNPYKRTPKGRKSRPKPEPVDWSKFLMEIDERRAYNRSGCSCPTAGCSHGCSSRSATLHCPFHGDDLFEDCGCDFSFVRISA